MRERYPIDGQFGIWAHVTPSLSRGALCLARLFMPLLPKGLRDGRVRTARLNMQGGKGLLIEGRACDAAAPCLVYFHGGGFVFGAARHHFEHAKAYAVGAGCKVLFAAYPLAPKHLFPAPERACLAAYRYAAEHAQELGIDARRIAVGGDSAGGYLAMDVIARARGEGLPAPCHALLIYPVAGGRETPSMRRFRDTPMWNARLNERMWAYHGGDRPPAAVPCLPSAYVETAQFDCLHDEGVHLAAALSDAGAAVTLNETKGTMHGFDAAWRSPMAQEARAARIASLRAAFYQQG